MPAYPGAGALLSDALLRRDRFGPNFGILVVEGSDDKRVFADRTHRRQQVIVADGKWLLLAAHAAALADDLSDFIVFLADCDYDVTMALLKPGPGLIITEHADLEADLLACGGWERIVGQLVPSTLDDDDRFNEAVASVMTRTVGLADILGRYRRVAREFRFEADTDIRHVRYRRSNSDEIDNARLLRSLWQSSRECALSLLEFEERISAISSDYDNCNGHDLVKAFLHVLREDFGVRDITADNLEVLLRHGVSRDNFEEWSVTRRIRNWELATKASILRP